MHEYSNALPYKGALYADLNIKAAVQSLLLFSVKKKHFHAVSG